MPLVDLELAQAHKLSEKEWEFALSQLGRIPSYPELGALSALWSEHCSYKSSRVHLQRLPTQGKRVIQGPGENAGIVDIGDGFAAVFKIESHNHPSFIEPYQGAATGLGGILRDVLSMGARPIACLDSLRFGSPHHPRTPRLLERVVAGIGGYGNCVGVPVVGGELFFDQGYDDNIVVNVFCCGVVSIDQIHYGRATGVGNSILYLGAKTGRDGLHGATMASSAFSTHTKLQKTNVQIGDPFVEKLVIEACLEIIQEHLIVGIQDMGAAGLTSSSVEMADRGNCGVDINLDLVPRRTQGLTPYELLLSESQERMLVVAKPEHEQRIFEICRKWELEAVRIGHVTATHQWVIRATEGYDPLAAESPQSQPVVVCDLPVKLLTTLAPRYDRPRQGSSVAVHEASDVDVQPDGESWTKALVDLMSSPNLGSRQWVFRQYDYLVRGNTEVRPGSDAAVLRIPCQQGERVVQKILAFAVDGNERLCTLDPMRGAAMAVVEACRNVVCSGAEPIGVTDCLNFGNPERPQVMSQLACAIDGIAQACRALDVPVVSGNVSLYNETDGRAIPPTPIVAVVGLVQSPNHVTRGFFPQSDLAIVLLGPSKAGPLGGSQYLAQRTGQTLGPMPDLDLKLECNLQRLLLDLVRCSPRLALSAHDVSHGGLAVALAECCCATDNDSSMVGARITLPSQQTLATALFGEAPSRVIVSVRPEHVADMRCKAEAAGVEMTQLGQTGGHTLCIIRDGQLVVDVELATLRQAAERCLQAVTGE